MTIHEYEAWPTFRLKMCVSNVVDQVPAGENGNRGLALESVASWTGRVGEAVPLDGMVKRFREGDVLFGKLRPYLAKVARPAHDGVCVGEFLVLRPREARIDPAFVEYVLRSKPVIEAVNASAYGARMPRAEWDSIGAMRISVPPLDEQAAIVRFLDDADRRIQRAIRAKQKLIALLNEQKQAVIHRVVMRGLDPNVRLRPSSVDWLGDIPQHWEVRRIKSLTLVKRGASPRPIADPRFFDDEGEYAWVRIADVSASGGELRATTQRVSELGKSLSVPLEPGALFLSIAGSVGKPVITGIKCCIHDGFVYFPTYEGDVTFLYRVFESGRLFEGLGKLGTQLNLNTGTVGSVEIPYPPLAEQRAIVSFLDDALAEIDVEADYVERSIELLREYRTRLIADAVTGRFDVRTAAPEPVGA